MRKSKRLSALFDSPWVGEISSESILTAAKEEMMMATLNLAAKVDTLTDECENLSQENDELQKTSTTDALTKLPNRLALNQALSKLDRRTENSEPGLYSIVMIDIDKFKTLNDTYGHDVGDQVLECVGAVLAENARGSDFVARYGGEEFTVILQGCPDDQAFNVAERFRSAIGRRGIELDTQTLFVTASAGVSTCHPGKEETSFDQILKRADKALYEAKRAGRDRTVQFAATETNEAKAVSSGVPNQKHSSEKSKSC